MNIKSIPQVYRIKVQGNLDSEWSKWLGNMSMETERTMNGSSTTVLVGPVADQAALRGILTRLWDLNLDIISVTRVHGNRGEV